MTISGETIYQARYRICGSTADIALNFAGTLGGTGSSCIYATLPPGVTPKNDPRQAYVGWGADGAGTGGAILVLFEDNTKISIYHIAGTGAWALGSAFKAYISVPSLEID